MATFKVSFPYAPDTRCKETDDGSIIAISSTYRLTESEGQGDLESIDYYSAYETRFLNGTDPSKPDIETAYRSVMNNLLRVTNGKLVSYEDVAYENHPGKMIKIKDFRDIMYYTRVFIIGSSIYAMEIA